MRIIFATTSNQIYSTFLLKALVSSRHRVAGVVFSDTMAPNRGVFYNIRKVIRQSGWLYFFLRSLEQFYIFFLRLFSKEIISTKDYARQIDLPVFRTKDINSKELLEDLRKLEGDIAVSAYFLQILKKDFIELFPRGCINIHRALLPKYRGPNSAFWQLANGETRSGTTVHYIDEGCDTGDIISQEEYQILPTDTHHSLCLKNAEVAAGLLVKAIDEIEKGIAPRIKQDPNRATKYSFPTKETARAFLKRGKRMF